MRISKTAYQKLLRVYEAGASIFKEGEAGNEMYIIVNGEVEIRKSTSGSSAKTLISYD